MTEDTDIVPEGVLDYGEILRRGGANFGDEDFALFKCPDCGNVYLLEYEVDTVDTVYLNPLDLSQRVPVSDRSFKCVRCGREVPDDSPWIGRRQDRRFAVAWKDLAASDWKWITQRTRAS
jgi:DNA-directed RNA polymerase subunit RPC12/RpoP